VKKLACKRLAEGSKKSAEDTALVAWCVGIASAFVNIRAIGEFWPIVNQQVFRCSNTKCGSSKAV